MESLTLLLRGSKNLQTRTAEGAQYNSAIAQGGRILTGDPLDPGLETAMYSS